MYDPETAAWREIFFKTNFNVDKCLSTYTQKSDLETLRAELKQYGTELHNAMSEILKTETEAIVYLAENLTNLNTRIEDLSLPISQLLEEIRRLYDAVKKVQECFEERLESIKLNTEEIKQLKLQMDIILSSLYVNNILKLDIQDPNEKLIYLERAVNKHSFQKMYLESSCEKPLDLDLSDIINRLLEEMNLFFIDSINKNDSEVLTRCLRMFVDLDLQSKAEKFYREKVVRPKLQNIFTQSNLDKHNQELNKIYEEVLQFLHSDLDVLLAVLEKNPDLKGFNFVINSLWYEVDKQLRENLPNITAPGNPDLFQKRFKETWEFFKKIATKCNNLSLLKNDRVFQEHIKRFNLAVYFEIRFQQIVAKIEEELLINTFSYEKEKVDGIQFHLKVTKEIWKSLKKCFSPDVFLDLLADQFVKLSMLILSRYVTYFDQNIPIALEKDDLGESFLFHGIIDLKLIERQIGSQSEISIYKTLPKAIQHLLDKITKLNTELINVHHQKLVDNLVQLKSQECVKLLAKVDSIPRLYRKTNRSFPKEASTYVVSAVEVITNFCSKYGKFKDHDSFSLVVDHIIVKITNQYLNHVQEVLKNVCKTEESLRRLKNRNQPTNDELSQSGDTVSDENKIREQIKLDVAYFKATLLPVARESSKLVLEKLSKESSFKK